MSGRLIVLDGLDGSGKHTQAQLLLGRLEAAGLPVVPIQRLKEEAEKITGAPLRPARGQRPVARVIGRDGALLDTIYNIPEK